MRTSPIHLIAALPVALGVAVAPVTDPGAVSTPAPVEATLEARVHEGKLSFSDQGPPKAYILLGGQTVLLSRQFTGPFPTSEDTATMRDLFESVLGMNRGASICVHGIVRQIGPLTLLEVEEICA